MKRLLVLGDSWMAGYVDGEGDTGILYNLLGTPPALRQAVSGSTATQWDSGYNNMLCKAMSTRCDAVVLSLGGNDALAALNDDGKITEIELNAMLAAVSGFVGLLASKFHEVYVVLYANPKPGDWKTAIAVMLLNAALASAVPSTVRLVRAASVLSSSDFPGTGIHPSRSGYEKLAALIRDEVGL